MTPQSYTLNPVMTTLVGRESYSRYSVYPKYYQEPQSGSSPHESHPRPSASHKSLSVNSTPSIHSIHRSSVVKSLSAPAPSSPASLSAAAHGSEVGNSTNTSAAVAHSAEFATILKTNKGLNPPLDLDAQCNNTVLQILDHSSRSSIKLVGISSHQVDILTHIIHRHERLVGKPRSLTYLAQDCILFIKWPTAIHETPAVAMASAVDAMFILLPYPTDLVGIHAGTATSVKSLDGNDVHQKVRTMVQAFLEILMVVILDIKEREPYLKPVSTSEAWRTFSKAESPLDLEPFVEASKSGHAGGHFSDSIDVAEHTWCSIKSVDYYIWIRDESNGGTILIDDIGDGDYSAHGALLANTGMDHDIMAASASASPFNLAPLESRVVALPSCWGGFANELRLGAEVTGHQCYLKWFWDSFRGKKHSFDSDEYSPGAPDPGDKGAGVAGPSSGSSSGSVPTPPTRVLRRRH
ncbi:hypothetical protein PAXINDRAFT_15468 [Paxillus involutus ATCC 200175]|uniref:Unplaced genomic scaffold PAXINscaffold_53, whole genome shotgun sequence n=1 Tax=Paxillus involutus ATCC 200175 TaxID=664439 RepID=A0A0C9SSZ7_PAXIN|nr:hypothetical protein PAXINDRAFT_15468 [Paxillus involutus ATCC 200175]